MYIILFTWRLLLFLHYLSLWHLWYNTMQVNTRIRTDACFLCSSKKDFDKTSHLSTYATDSPQKKVTEKAQEEQEKREVIIRKPSTPPSFQRTHSLPCLWLAKPINIQFSLGFVMKAAADCALGAANLPIYGDGKKSLSRGFSETWEGKDELSWM